MIKSDYPADKPSRYLYLAGGWTSVLFLAYLFATLIIFATIPEGYPDTAAECFNMLKENKFIALLRLDIISVIVIPFYYLLFFSIYRSLKTNYELIAKIALFCTLAGVTVFIAGVNQLSVIILSNKYHLTDSPEVKQQLLAACEGMMAGDMWVNTGSVIRGILIETGAIIFSVLMLKTLVFNKVTGWVGILTHGFDLSSILAGLVFPPVKEIFTMTAGPLYIVWFLLIGIRLFKLSKKQD